MTITSHFRGQIQCKAMRPTDLNGVAQAINILISYSYMCQVPTHRAKLRFLFISNLSDFIFYYLIYFDAERRGDRGRGNLVLTQKLNEFHESRPTMRKMVNADFVRRLVAVRVEWLQFLNFHI